MSAWCAGGRAAHDHRHQGATAASTSASQAASRPQTADGEEACRRSRTQGRADAGRSRRSRRSRRPRQFPRPRSPERAPPPHPALALRARAQARAAPAMARAEAAMRITRASHRHSGSRRSPTREYRRLSSTGIPSGVVGVTILVNRDGSVSNCRIARSSGNSSIDGLMCQLTLRYVRFRPALDATGSPVAQDITFFPNWRRRF